MSLDKRVKALSFDSLHQLIEQAHEEIDRRQRFIDQLPKLRLRDLTLSVRARDVLYRTVAEKNKLAYYQNAGQLTLCETLKLLVPDDWRHIRFKNGKAFDEIQLAFQNSKAPLELYYGLIEQTSLN